jgi:hypothetical protein
MSTEEGARRPWRAQRALLAVLAPGRARYEWEGGTVAAIAPLQQVLAEQAGRADRTHSPVEMASWSPAAWLYQAFSAPRAMRAGEVKRADRIAGSDR